jgi:RNA-directed DNA polymerase
MGSFPSIDHEILKALIRRKIKCKETLWLIDLIIDASNEQEAVRVHPSLVRLI